MAEVRDEKLKIVYGGKTLASEEVARQVVDIIMLLGNMDSVDPALTFGQLEAEGLKVDEIVRMVEEVFNIRLGDYKDRGMTAVKDLIRMADERIRR